MLNPSNLVLSDELITPAKLVVAAFIVASVPVSLLIATVLALCVLVKLVTPFIAISPLPSKLVLFIVFILVPLTKIACFPPNASNTALLLIALAEPSANVVSTTTWVGLSVNEL